MKAVADFPDVRYAVIEGLQTETGHEHIVIAYRSEKSLRDAFAASSIVAFGLSTRGEAMAAGRTSSPTPVAVQRIKKVATAEKTNLPQHRLDRAQARREPKSVVRIMRNFLVRSFSELVTSAVVIFSSPNTVSAAIRMALGSSI